MILKSYSGLLYEFNSSGTVRSIEAGPIRINLKETSEFHKSGTGLYLRKKDRTIDYLSLIGPESNGQFVFENNRYYSKGNWEGLEYLVELQLSEKGLSWQWTVQITNKSARPVEADVVYVQDAGLKTKTNGLVNEYYVSQYIERLVLNHDIFGKVICCRQNLKEPLGNPWLMIGCKEGAPSASVDGIQFYDPSYREKGIPAGLLDENLGGEYAGESSVLAIQVKPFLLHPHQTHISAIAGKFLMDHPEPTSDNDLNQLDNLFSEFSPIQLPTDGAKWQRPKTNLFNQHQLLPADDLTHDELTLLFGSEWRHVEEVQGTLLSFFKDDHHHVVLKAKELLADRPHGHIMQAMSHLTPADDMVSTTSFAYGVFNSHITQGNTNFNSLLSVCSNPFNLASPAGQRIFVCFDDKMFLLGVPSAFEMGLNHCRWIYKYGTSLLEVLNWTSKEKPQVILHFRVIRGEKTRLILSHHFDEANDWKVIPSENQNEFVVKPGKNSLIHEKYPQAQFRLLVQGDWCGFSFGNGKLLQGGDLNHDDGLFVIQTHETDAFTLSIFAEVPYTGQPVIVNEPLMQFKHDCMVASQHWNELSQNLNLELDHPDVKAIKEILPWFGANALTHYLTPYGLEQFGGAAWGTRDVSQGPIDLLMNLGKYKEVRQVLCIIFSHQNPDGGWPQWWMFDRYFNIRAHEAHGDIAYWCIIALANYISTTGDLKILDEILPYYHAEGLSSAEKTPLREHMDRLLNRITGSFIQGTALVPFGGGDWNDSLQPVSEELASRMISSWTVQMNYQAFSQYAEVLELDGNLLKSRELKAICQSIKNDFNKHLVKEGVVAGYGLAEPDGSISVLLHPSDNKTGIHYSLLPMNRGVLSGIFTNEQAVAHRQIIEQHLKGPDGARLMDKPLKYRGGIQSIFQRAESSTFFGREIGLMYIHEHLRYAESLAIMGKADDFVFALRQALPVDYQKIVAGGDFRQANCYYSSSDIGFKSRYEADERYHEINSGKITFRGGWRVYSSGPGIFIGLVISRLLGIRVEHSNIVLDPVMPISFDGLAIAMNFLEHRVRFLYRIHGNRFAPKTVLVNGNPLEFAVAANPYRTGGSVLDKAQFLNCMQEGENLVEIYM